MDVAVIRGLATVTTTSSSSTSSTSPIPWVPSSASVLRKPATAADVSRSSSAFSVISLPDQNHNSKGTLGKQRWTTTIGTPWDNNTNTLSSSPLERSPPAQNEIPIQLSETAHSQSQSHTQSGQGQTQSTQIPTTTTAAPITATTQQQLQREPLRGLSQIQEPVPATAQATPFLPGISGGIWSPPSAPAWTGSTSLTPAPVPPPPAPEKDDKKDEEKDAHIRLLQDMIDRLAREKDLALTDNARLCNEVEHLSALVTECIYTPRITQPIAPPRILGALPFNHSVSQLNSGGYHNAAGLALHDPHRLGMVPHAPMQESAIYRPTQMTIDLILSGQIDYLRMDPRSEYDLIRPLVWTIAHQEPKSNAQAATLKVAANALGGRLGQPRSMPLTQYLVSVILESAKSLCYTSNGNYLCQQLLEKGTTDDKINFIKVIESDLIAIANNKFGAHVLVKAISVMELELLISEALFKYGVFESMQTGARKVWRPYLGKCRNSNEVAVFQRMLNDMKGRWADLAVCNENGSISVQQVFEGCASEELMDACFQEIVSNISRVANNQFGHFVVNKLLNVHEPIAHGVSHAILAAYPPLATNHHGVQFVEFVLSSNRVLQRSNIVKYLESLCSQQDGRTAAIVTVANSSVGRGHLQGVLRQVSDRILIARIQQTCRQYQTTLRNSQSGNELLRSLGIINTPARRS